MSVTRFPAALAAVAMMTSIIPFGVAHAQTVESLQKQIDALQAQLNALKAEQKEAAKHQVKVKWEPAPKISSADGRFEMNMRGRLFVDGAWVNDSDNASNVDATELRAARLGIEGKAWNNMTYRLEADFSGNKVSIADAFIGYKFGIGQIHVGHIKSYNSLEETTSSRFTTFMERGSITDAFAFGRRIGIGLQGGGSHWSAAVGYGKGGASGGAKLDEGDVISARITYAPIAEEGRVVHIGAHFRTRKAGADESLFGYSQRPHQHLAAKFLDTGAFADKDTLYGLELAGVLGPLSAQGEYMWLKADRALPVAGYGNPTFKGWNAGVSWFLTGESRSYKASSGSFGRVKVRNPLFESGLGALQVAVRYDYLDLVDQDIFGGRQKTWIFGANWYLNDYSRVMVNYSTSKIDRALLVALNGSDGRNSVDAFGMRFQVDW